MVANGNKVVFAKSASYAEDETTGEKIEFIERGGMYTMKLWVSNPRFQGQATPLWP